MGARTAKRGLRRLGRAKPCPGLQALLPHGSQEQPAGRWGGWGHGSSFPATRPEKGWGVAGRVRGGHAHYSPVTPTTACLPSRPGGRASRGRAAVQGACPLWPLGVGQVSCLPPRLPEARGRWHVLSCPCTCCWTPPGPMDGLKDNEPPGLAPQGSCALWRDLPSAQTPTMLYNLRLLTPSQGGRVAGHGVGVFCKHLKQLIFKKSQL